MLKRGGVGNEIDKTAVIADNVILGNYNYIGKNVVISGFKGALDTRIIIGDCNYIHDNTRILIGEDGLVVGDWNVFHNSMLVMGQKEMSIGHNCWFGQNTILDSTAGLFIGSGVRVGLYSQIWTHVASGELIEGCSLFKEEPTIIEDEVWLVGSCNVGLGIRIGKRAICMNGSLITKNVRANSVVRGSPAKEVEGLSFYKEISIKEKLSMMNGWILDFIALNNKNDYSIEKNNSSVAISNNHGERLIFSMEEYSESMIDDKVTFFDLKLKKYTKKLTALERSFYRFIYDHKARFLPF
jgi:acetyltransferase-like isoleucine patch superfamily enzyme